jgi:hypothetical protein
MIEIYKKIVIPSFIWGFIGGILILIQLYVKMTLYIAGPVILIINVIAIIFIMIASVFFYRKRVGQIEFIIARELSFFVYLITVIILLVFRFTQGYVDKFSFPVILLGILFLYGLGRTLSYIIGMNMYNVKSNK